MFIVWPAVSGADRVLRFAGGVFGRLFDAVCRVLQGFPGIAHCYLDVAFGVLFGARRLRVVSADDGANLFAAAPRA